ncbi:MAG: citrate lyase subunit beta [Bacteroidales bacterium]|nr:citrate lyase subunit beta [Bacteroidales bacterium]HOY38640.1 aldolase/citrate lyase family protein [Bacteroidales bacterium]HQP05144.1 aldolase/citrate lyase family protein [Bacteroidales bacterium]
MSLRIAEAGNEGPKVRSDCKISIELKESGGLEINLKSKVQSLYGDDINNQMIALSQFFGITNATVTIIDQGALPFVIAARFEAAWKQLANDGKEWLPDFLPQNKYHTRRDLFRFTRLYLPGNTPAMMLNAGLHGSDGIILDLEDSVAPAKKDEARLLIRNVLRCIDLFGSERMVRINQGQRGLDDLKYVIPHNVNLILVPKCESVEYLHEVDATIEKYKAPEFKNHPVYLMPIIESALGIEMAFDIARATPNVVALAIGLEDFTADLGTKRTQEGTESMYARWRLVNACKAAGIQPIDSVYSDVDNMDGLRENVKTSKSLGFEGMGCIHPRQVPVIKDSFKPDDEELGKAMKIVLAAEEATKAGLGVISLGSKMIDPPVVKRAERTLNLALNLKIIDKNWRDNYVS